MPKGEKCQLFTEQEQMRIAEVYRRETVRKFSACKWFVRQTLDGGARRRANRLAEGTIQHWAKKLELGQAPGDDRRRLNKGSNEFLKVPVGSDKEQEILQAHCEEGSTLSRSALRFEMSEATVSNVLKRNRIKPFKAKVIIIALYMCFITIYDTRAFQYQPLEVLIKLFCW